MALNGAYPGPATTSARPSRSPRPAAGVRCFFLAAAATALCAAASWGQAPDFRADQLRHPRVRAAYATRAAALAARFRSCGLPYPPAAVYLRGFKAEQVLELWARRDSREPFRRVAEYPFCATSGELGPKRREGDGQIPEGFYLVDRFNPASRFHLSLGLNYPNASDRRRGLPGQLGGDIFIHGGCATIGCIPLTDAGIEDIYLAAVEAVGSGQAAVPAHIFPARLDEAGYARLHEHFTGRPDLLGFWREIRPAFLFFEAHRRLPRIGVDSEGRYRIQP